MTTVMSSGPGEGSFHCRGCNASVKQEEDDKQKNRVPCPGVNSCKGILHQ